MAADVRDLVHWLGSSQLEEALDGADALCEVLGVAYGDEGATFCAALRAEGAIPLLQRLLSSPEPIIQQRALFALGNMCSGAVDPASDETKRLLLAAGGAEPLLACARSEDEEVRLLAAGALQNLCHDATWSRALVQLDVVPLLEELVRRRGAVRD